LVIVPGCKKREYLDAKKQSIVNVSPEKLVQFLDEKYLLDPDRRFLMALEELDSFFLGQKKQVTAKYYDSRWYVFSGKKEIGNLPRYPSYNDFWELLSSRVAKLEKRSSLKIVDNPGSELDPLLKQQIESFAPRNIIAALKSIDKLWGGGTHSTPLLMAGCRALVFLSFQSLNELQEADALQAKALALLGIAKQLTGKKLALEEAILTYNMGYNGQAHQAAAGLSTQAPFYLFLNGEFEALEKIAGRDSSPLIRYIRLWAEAKKRKEKDWLQLSVRLFEEEGYLLPMVKAGLTMNRFGFSGNTPGILSYEITDQILAHTGNMDMGKMLALYPTLSSLVAAFEDSVAKVPVGGSFFDSRAQCSYYRSNFYSALYLQGSHLLFSLASVPSASSFLSSLGNHQSPYFKEFKAWFEGLVTVHMKNDKGKGLLKNMTSRTKWSGRVLIDTYDEILDRYYHIYQTRLQGAAWVFVRLDSRIQHRFYAAKIAKNSLLDLSLAEELLTSLVKSSNPRHFPDIHVFYYKYNKEFDKLFELISQSWVPSETKSWALRLLEDCDEVDGARVEKGFVALLKQDPGSWNFTQRYTNYLISQNKNREAREIMEKWLENHGPKEGFDYINAKKEVAKLYLKEGLYKEGINVLRPVMSSGQAGCMETMARLLSRLGRLRESLALMDRVLERYPQIDRSRVILAQILWENKDYQKAAHILKAYPIDYKPFTWGGEIGARFYDVFNKRSPNEGQNAFKELIKVGFGPFKLRHIPYLAAKNKNYEMAFRLQSLLNIRGHHILYLRMDAYGYLKKWQGKEAALKWIKTQPVTFPRMATLMPYEFEHDELYWEWLPKPSPIDEISRMIMKALAYVRSKNKNPKRKALLADFFKEKAEEPYYAQGKYLMDLLPEKELLKFMEHTKQKCEIPFFVAQKREEQGKIYQANQWYRLCMETGMHRVTEFGWARNRLNKWVRSGYFLKHQ